MIQKNGGVRLKNPGKNIELSEIREFKVDNKDNNER